MRALIVDDSKAMRAILRLILGRRGFEVMEAQNGQNGLQVLQENGSFELALLDWNMPVMDGLDLLRALRSDSRFDSMRVMMVTTETEVMEVRRALELGADEYVMKPFTPDVVLDKLQMLGF